MTLEQQKERISEAFIYAIAAACGLNPYRLRTDDQSIDMGLTVNDRDRRFPRVDLQLKCTAVPMWAGDDLYFDLPIKNYEDLRCGTDVPRFLVVVIVPPEPSDWVKIDKGKCTLRCEGYWQSLRRARRSGNKAMVRVRLPRHQMINADSLQAMMGTKGVQK